MKKRYKFHTLVFFYGAVLLIIFVLPTILFSNDKNNSFHEKEISASSPNPSPTLTPTLTPKPSPTPTPKIYPTKVPMVTVNKQSSLDDLFAKYGSIYGVDPNELRKIASCESGFDPNQVTGIYGGLFQFSDLSWTEARGRMGLSADQNLKFNAEEAIKTAAFEINYKGTSGWSDCD